MPADRPVAGVVLAAGLSRRAGPRNKLLVPVDGEPMVARAVDVAVAAGLTPIVVVTGHEAGAVEAALGGRAVAAVRNSDPDRGLASSLARGVAALPRGVTGVVVLLGDMPWVSPGTVRCLVAAFDPGAGATVCVPRHRGRRGNPVLWGAGHFAEMGRLTGDTGAARLLADHPDAVVYVDVDDPGVHRDLDDEAALARLDDGAG